MILEDLEMALFFPDSAILAVAKCRLALLCLLIAGFALMCHAEPVRLNEQVLALEVQEGASFENPRAGWIFVRADGGMEQDFAISGEDGKAHGDLRQCYDGYEWIGRLPEGKFSVKGFQGSLTVHAIPEIYFYAPGISNCPELNGRYDWPEMGGHWLRSVTTLSNGHMDWKSLGIFRSYGRVVLNNISSAFLNDDDYAAKTMKYVGTIGGFTDTNYDGLSMDEYPFISEDTTAIEKQTRFLRMAGDPPPRPVYTWIHGIGRPANVPARKAFLDAACTDDNRAMMEIYMPTYPTQKEAETKITERYLDFMQGLHAIDKDINPRFGIVAGSFNEIASITLEHFADVDFRYYLDMQLNLIANSGEFRDMGLVGYWGCNYVTEDLQLWGLALLRHYFIEGRRDMLSEKYGFTYKTPYLVNCDFASGLDGWEYSGPDASNVFHADASEYEFAQQSVECWGHGDKTRMNHLAVLRKSASGANVLSQKVRHLKPGHAYTLHFISANYYEMRTLQRRPHKTGIRAFFGDGEVEAQEERLFVDRNLSRNSKSGVVNVHRIDFVPLAEEITLSFTDEFSNGNPEEELGITFIQIKERFIPEEVSSSHRQ